MHLKYIGQNSYHVFINFNMRKKQNKYLAIKNCVQRLKLRNTALFFSRIFPRTMRSHLFLVLKKISNIYLHFFSYKQQLKNNFAEQHSKRS
jgi:hypothetical protein